MNALTKSLLRTLPPRTIVPRSSALLSPATAWTRRAASSSSTPPKPESTSDNAGQSPAPENNGSEEGQSTRSKALIGPFSLRAAGLFALTGTTLYFYFQREKAKVEARKKAETASAKVGRPQIGGKFNLVDQDGKPFTEKELVGGWTLVYFGFTNCPDICPEELDKMSKVIDSIEETNQTQITPVFITCDPARDTVAQVKAYVKDFHTRLVGLTGTYEDIKKACKVYRVYFSTPPTALATEDYLVDHSIFFYLMDPTGQFVDAFGRSLGTEEVGSKIRVYLAEWQKGGGRGPWSPERERV